MAKFWRAYSMAPAVPIVAAIMTSQGKQQHACVHLAMIATSVSVRRIALQFSFVAGKTLAATAESGCPYEVHRVQPQWARDIGGI
jgi:hypothetical protein